MTADDGGPDNPRPGRDRLLTDLGADLQKLRTDLSQTSEQVRGELRELAGVVAELPPQVTEHGNEIAAIKGVLEELTGEEEQPKNPPIDWPSLTAEEAEQQWDVLAKWVGNVFVPYHEITRGQLPDCWAMHWPAVVELSWLRTCHVQAYLPKSSPTAAAEWHTRWRDGALDNIAKSISETWCRPGEHHVHHQQSQRHQPASQQQATPWQQQPVQQGQQPPWAAQPQQQAAPTAYYQETEREQLASPQHWEQWWHKAKAEDVARRRQQETVQQQTDQSTG